MSDYAAGIIDRYLLASAEFERKLREVRPGQWSLPTPCTEWNVRQLVNHMTRGNLNYVGLASGGTGAEFLRLRDADALGTDPVGAYTESVGKCAEAFARPGVLQRVLDYPLGRVTGRQALAVRTADSAVHTWDLGRAADLGEILDAGLVTWAGGHLDEIYAGLAVAPGEGSARRFFAPPESEPEAAASGQDRLLHWMGRHP
jgi:uncharacterized protein (TIGR03086 family)